MMSVYVPMDVDVSIDVDIPIKVSMDAHVSTVVIIVVIPTASRNYNYSRAVTTATVIAIAVLATPVIAGCWNNMTFCLWGRGVELLVDAATLALNNQIKIYANLLADVGVRYPGAFAVTAPLT